ncbi:MAG: hypothetical protein HY304_00845 [candidate division Zixibacteria bacterium]|nr:hypothetical protein [candidate division Zixibacteria bacterium]
MSDPAPEPPLAPLVAASGNYEYLSEDYYRCQDMELSGLGLPRPTCAEALDAYIVPVALEKARMAGLAVPEWFLSNEYFHPPAVVDSINPFSRRFAVVRSEDERAKAAQQLTWNFKFAMCVQKIATTTEVIEIRVVGGRSEQTEFADWASLVHIVFAVPIATVRLLRTDNQIQFSAISILPHRTLSAQERRWADSLAGRGRG